MNKLMVVASGLLVAMFVMAQDAEIVKVKGRGVGTTANALKTDSSPSGPLNRFLTCWKCFSSRIPRRAKRGVAEGDVNQGCSQRPAANPNGRGAF